MYARYDYNAGATAANIMADIVAILTGAATTSATLSASCNKPNTTITSTVAPGWTVHDAAAGSGAQVLKAPFADASGFKYAYLNFTATTYDARIAEAWNASTHAGTNVGLITGAVSAGYSPTAGGTVFLFAAATHLFILCFTGSTYGLLAAVMERTRASLWDTSGVGVPPFVGAGANTSAWRFNESTSGVASPRSKSATFTDVTGASATYYPVSLWGNVSAGGQGVLGGYTGGTLKTCDASGVAQFVTTDVYVANAVRGDMGGQLYGIKQISIGGNTSDDVSVGGQTWFYVGQVQLSGGATGACLCLPKF